MKKLFVLAGISLFLMSSCSKDWTCKCVTSEGGVQIGTSSTTITDKKNDAKAACDEGDGTLATYTVDCEIQ